MLPLLYSDFYKVDHRRQYPPNTSLVYSNFTPRASRIPGVDKVVVFGLQYFLKKVLIDDFEGFFDIMCHEGSEYSIKEYKRIMDNTLGPNAFPMDHIDDLYNIGYLPVEIKALPEGSLCPLRVPILTIKNTLPEFFWLPNFLETILSNTLWMPITSATIAFEYRKLLQKYAEETSDMPEFVPWQGHDFSMRGHSSLESSILSGMGHLLSFTGTDTIPAILGLEGYYGANVEKELVGGSVPACYDDKTEILTNTGFKLFKDLDKNDLVAQYHEDGQISFVKPEKYYQCDYNGSMIHFTKGGYNYVDMVVTPNHKMVRRSGNKIQLFEAGSRSEEHTSELQSQR